MECSLSIAATSQLANARSAQDVLVKLRDLTGNLGYMAVDVSDFIFLSISSNKPVTKTQK